MIIELLRQQVKSFFRSGSFQRELLLQIFVGLIFLYLLIVMIFLAFQLPDLLQKVEGDPIVLLHTFLLYYFVGELMVRYFLQSTPALDLEPYLHLPVKKSKISFYLQLKSLLHPINFLAALLTGPFAFKVIAPEHGVAEAWIWWLSIISISFALHFFMLIFRRKWEARLVTWIILLVISGVNYLLSYYGIFDIAAEFAKLFNLLLEVPAFAVIPVFVAIILAYSSYSYYRKNLYLENIGSEKKSTGESYTQRLSFLSTYGTTGSLILQEIRLIIRHKRSRSFLIMTFFLLFYGLIFLDDYTGGFKTILVFIGVFITGIFAFNYGQMLWGWKTNLLDFYFTRPFELHVVVKSLYRFLTMTCLICGMLSIPYVYFGWEVLATFMACMFFNIGVNIPLMMGISMWKPSAMDINKTAFMNYQGVGPAQWLSMLPVMGLPIILYLLIGWISNGLVAIVIIGLIGLVAMLCSEWTLRWLTHRLHKQKYILVKNLNL